MNGKPCLFMVNVAPLPALWPTTVLLSCIFLNHELCIEIQIRSQWEAEEPKRMQQVQSMNFITMIVGSMVLLRQRDCRCASSKIKCPMQSLAFGKLFNYAVLAANTKFGMCTLGTLCIEHSRRVVDINDMTTSRYRQICMRRRCVPA